MSEPRPSDIPSRLLRHAGHCPNPDSILATDLRDGAERIMELEGENFMLRWQLECATATHRDG